MALETCGLQVSSTYWWQLYDEGQSLHATQNHRMPSIRVLKGEFPQMLHRQSISFFSLIKLTMLFSALPSVAGLFACEGANKRYDLSLVRSLSVLTVHLPASYHFQLPTTYDVPKSTPILDLRPVPNRILQQLLPATKTKKAAKSQST